MRWKYCNYCPLDGTCENQDRGCECEMPVKKLLEENAKLKEDYNRLGKLLQKMEDSDNAREKFQNEQIEKLKELLKECKPYVNHRFMRTREILTKPYTASDKVLHKKAEKLLTKIEEVLK